MVAVDNFATINGLRIQYTEFGRIANPHLLCLHGFSLESHNWDVFAEHASQRYHVVCPTVPGHGDSDRRDSYDDQLADIHLLDAFMDAQGIDSATFLGHSMGGMYAAGLAVFHRPRVERIVMVDAGLDTRAPGAERFQAWIDAWQPQLPSVEATREYIATYYPNWSRAAAEAMIRHAGRVTSEGRFRWKLDPTLMSARKSPQPEEPEESPLWPLLARIPCPTLIVRGQNSDILRSEIVERMVATLPQGSSVEARGVGHGMMMEDEDAFYEAVRGPLGLE